jgi:hypothetical protein
MHTECGLERGVAMAAPELVAPGDEQILELGVWFGLPLTMGAREAGLLGEKAMLEQEALASGFVGVARLRQLPRLLDLANVIGRGADENRCAVVREHRPAAIQRGDHMHSGIVD